MGQRVATNGISWTRFLVCTLS